MLLHHFGFAKRILFPSRVACCMRSNPGYLPRNIDERIAKRVSGPDTEHNAPARLKCLVTTSKYLSEVHNA
jgi:hypothetical protein